HAVGDGAVVSVARSATAGVLPSLQECKGIFARGKSVPWSPLQILFVTASVAAGCPAASGCGPFGCRLRARLPSRGVAGRRARRGSRYNPPRAVRQVISAFPGSQQAELEDAGQRIGAGRGRARPRRRPAEPRRVRPRRPAELRRDGRRRGKIHRRKGTPGRGGHGSLNVRPAIIPGGRGCFSPPTSLAARSSRGRKNSDTRLVLSRPGRNPRRGGKVAMALALQGHPAVSKLVVLDVSPVDAPLSRDFVRYLDVMREVQAACVAKRSDADRIMLDSVPELDVRQFLLTNLKKDPDTGRYHFRIPLGIIAESLDDLGKFPVGPRRRAKDDAAAAAADADGRERGRDDATYDRPALVIYGSRARYVTEGTKPVFRRFFPNVRFEELDAGHWVSRRISAFELVISPHPARGRPANSAELLRRRPFAPGSRGKAQGNAAAGI
ncbi:MAG: hypothetical protein BJ554DRAFT_4388, partial [Olpidium bornovanus]